MKAVFRLALQLLAQGFVFFWTGSGIRRLLGQGL